MGVLPIINPYDPGVSSDMSKAWKKVAKEAYASISWLLAVAPRHVIRALVTPMRENPGAEFAVFFCVVYDFKNPDVFALVYEIYCR